MAETKIDKTERKTLIPTWVGEPTQLPNSQVKVLRFNADDGLQYETFKASLFPYVQVGQSIDADTELRITTTEQGTQYPHWRIVQIYKDGKPISSEKQQKTYGRDEDRTDIRTTILEIGQNYRADKWDDKDPRVVAYKLWLSQMVGAIETKAVETAHKISSKEIAKPIAPQEKTQPKIEPSATEDLSWANIQPDVKSLWDNKIKGWHSTVSIMKTLESLGADVSSGKIKTVYENLEDKAKKEFIRQVKEAEKLGGKEE